MMYIYSFGQTKEDISKKEYGIIQGYVSVASSADYVPKLKVCAMHVADTSIKYCTDEILCEERERYSLKVPSGIYYVYSFEVAPYIQDKPVNRAYYTDKVIYDFTSNCYLESDERSILLKVKVCPNEIVENINPEDEFWKEILIIKPDTIISIKRR